jgi:hypothetical protein
MVPDLREVQVVDREPHSRIHFGGLGSLSVATAAELIENLALRSAIAGDGRCCGRDLRSCRNHRT